MCLTIKTTFYLLHMRAGARSLTDHRTAPLTLDCEVVHTMFVKPHTRSKVQLNSMTTTALPQNLTFVLTCDY
jgi:hypothetical protein